MGRKTKSRRALSKTSNTLQTVHEDGELVIDSLSDQFDLAFEKYLKLLRLKHEISPTRVTQDDQGAQKADGDDTGEGTNESVESESPRYYPDSIDPDDLEDILKTMSDKRWKFYSASRIEPSTRGKHLSLGGYISPPASSAYPREFEVRMDGEYTNLKGGDKWFSVVGHITMTDDRGLEVKAERSGESEESEEDSDDGECHFALTPFFH